MLKKHLIITLMVLFWLSSSSCMEVKVIPAEGNTHAFFVKKEVILHAKTLESQLAQFKDLPHNAEQECLEVHTAHSQSISRAAMHLLNRAHQTQDKIELLDKYLNQKTLSYLLQTLYLVNYFDIEILLPKVQQALQKRLASVRPSSKLIIQPFVFTHLAEKLPPEAAEPIVQYIRATHPAIKWLLAKTIQQSPCISTLKGHTSQVTGVCFSPDSKFLATASKDKTAKIWNLKTSECTQTLKDEYELKDVAFSHNGKLLATMPMHHHIRDTPVKIWDVHSGKLLHTLAGHQSIPLAVCFSYDDTFLVTASFDQTAKAWNTETGACLHTFSTFSEGHRPYIAFNPSSNLLAYSHENKIRFFDLGNNDYYSNHYESSAMNCHLKKITALQFNASGILLASGSFDKTVKIWNPKTGALIKTINLPEYDYAEHLLFDQEDTLIICSSHKIYIVSKTTNDYQKFESSEQIEDAVLISGTPLLVTTTSWRNSINFFNTTAGKNVHTLKGGSICINSTGSLLANGVKEDNAAKIWQLGSSSLDNLDFKQLLFVIYVYEAIKQDSYITICKHSPLVHIYESFNEHPDIKELIKPYVKHQCNSLACYIKNIQASSNLNQAQTLSLIVASLIYSLKQ